MTQAFVAVEAVVAGAVAGSILASAIYRVPRQLSMFTTARSRCDGCGATVAWLDLVPIVSWFALGGRCRWCDEPISPRYPYTEIGLGALSGTSLAVVMRAPIVAATIAGTGLAALALTAWRWRALAATHHPASRRHERS